MSPNFQANRFDISSLIGFATLIFSAYLFINNIILISTAEHTIGEITAADCQDARTGRLHHVVCNYKVTYHTDNGTQAHVLDYQVASSNGHHLREQVDILYPRSSPQSAKLYNETLWLFPVALLIFGLFFSSIRFLK